MSHLKSYIIAELKFMADQSQQSFEQAADRVMARILDPNNNPAPKMTGEQTKRKSYDQLGDLSKQHMTILQLLQSSGSLSRQEISNRTGIKIGAVCGRILELRANNFVYEDGTTEDPDTGRTVTTLAAVV
jgi:DNA-binding MarR family transcriptional regulator